MVGVLRRDQGRAGLGHRHRANAFRYEASAGQVAYAYAYAYVHRDAECLAEPVPNGQQQPQRGREFDWRTEPDPQFVGSRFVGGQFAGRESDQDRQPGRRFAGRRFAGCHQADRDPNGRADRIRVGDTTRDRQHLRVLIRLALVGAMPGGVPVVVRGSVGGLGAEGWDGSPFRP